MTSPDEVEAAQVQPVYDTRRRAGDEVIPDAVNVVVTPIPTMVRKRRTDRPVKPPRPGRLIFPKASDPRPTMVEGNPA